jgi:hypothetical protein
MPPIDAHEFFTNFYFCFRGGQKHKHRLPFSRCYRQCRRHQAPVGAAECIPKRNRGIEQDDFDHRRGLWGLVAVERISFARVSVYHLLMLSGPFAFWFLWLYYWQNTTDLQNASVPLSVVCTLLSLF